MSTRVSLAQQIALLSQTAPADLDPEDIHPAAPQSENDSHEINPAATEHYIDVGPSNLRQSNAALSDPKYEGRRVSRKDLESEDNEHAEDSQHEEDTEEESIDDDGPIADVSKSKVPARPVPTNAQEEGLRHEAGITSDLASALRVTRVQDRRKGKAVARQITLWDSLLDARIRLQKTVNALNRSATTSTSTSTSFEVSLYQMLDEAISLSEEMTTLRETVLRIDGTPTTFPYPRKRAKLSHGDRRDHTTELRTLSTNASDVEAAYHSHLIQTLAKWSSKIQAVSPGALLPAYRSSFKNTTAKPAVSDVVETIDTILESDSQKLLARTRSTLNIPSANDKDDLTPAILTNIFDDADFYQQLLRDVVESRDSAGGAGEQTWIRRQKTLKAKRRQTLDTRASKGRKLRHQVHEKLQNFMAPVGASLGAWHDEQVDELFTSLLGASHHT